MPHAQRPPMSIHNTNINSLHLRWFAASSLTCTTHLDLRCSPCLTTLTAALIAPTLQAAVPTSNRRISAREIELEDGRRLQRWGDASSSSHLTGVFAPSFATAAHRRDSFSISALRCFPTPPSICCGAFDLARRNTGQSRLSLEWLWLQTWPTAQQR
jgi:hypothetical protein